ncbi:hypothetical protein X801_10693, partial [Opisthorchis viverrini]
SFSIVHNHWWLDTTKSTYAARIRLQKRNLIRVKVILPFRVSLTPQPYSAQDPASTHVFCFCATDEKALRHWVCRLRIAKFGRQLFVDYQNAMARIQRQIAMTYGVPTGLHGMNGSLSACIQRKSSFDILSSSASTAALLPAGSASSLVAGTGSPSIPKRSCLGNNYNLYDQRYPVAPMTKEAGQPQQQNQENSRP